MFRMRFSVNEIQESAPRGSILESRWKNLSRDKGRATIECHTPQTIPTFCHLTFLLYTFGIWQNWITYDKHYFSYKIRRLKYSSITLPLLPLKDFERPFCRKWFAFREDRRSNRLQRSASAGPNK